MIEVKPDLIATMEREGIELKRKGRSFWVSCPLHEDRTPSLKVDPDKQIFFCFSCHCGGDVITFVQKLHGLSFKDALKHLGMKPGSVPVVNDVDVLKRRMVKAFRKWEWRYRGDLAERFREINEKTHGLKAIEEAEAVADLFHELPLVEYRIKILSEGTDEEKLNLFREVNVGR